MRTLLQVIEELQQNPITNSMNKRYTNSCSLNGFVLKKPHFIKHDTRGIESCSLLLYQLFTANGTNTLQTYTCMVFEKDLVDQLKSVDKVMLFAVSGKLKYSKIIKGLYLHILEIHTLCETDIDLVEQEKEK